MLRVKSVIFFLDKRSKGTRGHGAKLVKIRSNREVLKHIFHGGWLLSDGMIRAWTALKHKLQENREIRVVFYGSPLNPTSLACGSTAVEAAQALKPGKEKKHRLEAPIQVVRVVGWISCVRTTTLSYLSASEMTYIVSSRALNSTHSLTQQPLSGATALLGNGQAQPVWELGTGNIGTRSWCMCARVLWAVFVHCLLVRRPHCASRP